MYVYPDGPISGPYKGQADYIQVIIQSNFNTFFASLFGRFELDNTSEAVVKATGRAPILGGDLVWGYNTSKCPTVSTNGGVDVILTNGNLFDNSAADGTKNNCDAMSTSGTSGTITAVNGNIDVVGSVDTDGKPSIDPPPTTGVDHQYIVDVPPPRCSDFPDRGHVKINGDQVLEPGRYSNISIEGGGNVTLNPGLYCLIPGSGVEKGNFIATSAGTVSGSGVMIAMFGGLFDLGGSQNISLTAPLPEELVIHNTVNDDLIDYAGMLIYANPASYTGDKQKTFQINGNVDSDTTSVMGTIYAPTTGCTINGNVGFTSVNTQMICDTVTFGGNGVISMSLNSDNPFKFGGIINLMQ